VAEASSAIEKQTLKPAGGSSIGRTACCNSDVVTVTHRKESESDSQGTISHGNEYPFAESQIRSRPDTTEVSKSNATDGAMTSAGSRAIAVLIVVAVLSCRDATAPNNSFIQFKVDAPLCGGSQIKFRFAIDDVVIGTEMLRDGQTSLQYPTTAGQHGISTSVYTAPFTADSTVTLIAGGTTAYPTSVYCS
jgi:hypothetical protein